MVSDPGKAWIGLEYFCNEGDCWWEKDDDAMKRHAVDEMERIGVLARKDVVDGVVLRVPKAYPAYYGSYDQFDTIRAWTDEIPNLFLIGRNGMHRYNNMDHSMLTAMTAVECALEEQPNKGRIWSVNAEPDYHESGG
jgi:protoporphyrinogen oxidase